MERIRLQSIMISRSFFDDDGGGGLVGEFTAGELVSETVLKQKISEL